MTESETEEDGCDGGSGDEEEGDDEVEVVKGSGSHVSVKPILLLLYNFLCPRFNCAPCYSTVQFQ
jgi:hypothetical protein